MSEPWTVTKPETIEAGTIEFTLRRPDDPDELQAEVGRLRQRVAELEALLAEAR
jgi:hypothetical protein